MLGGFSSTKRILWGGLPMLATGHHYNSDQMKLSQASWFTKRKGLPSGKHSWLERGSSGRRSRLQHLPYISPSHPQEFAPSCRRTRWGNLRLAGQSPFRRLSAQTRQSRFLSFRWPSKVSSSAIAQIYGMDCAPKIHVWTTCIEFSIILSIYPQVICHTIIYILIIQIIGLLLHLLLFKTNCRYHWWHLPEAFGAMLGVDRMGGLGPHMLHVWNIYLYIYHKYVLNVGTCSIHGASQIDDF